jgi:hypothetical protein
MELFSSRFARFALAALAFAVVATEAPSAMAACAVSSLNGKLDAGAGVAQAGSGAATDGALQLGATLSAPLGCDWGLQIDAAGLRIDNANAGAVGAHLFTRDPSHYLLGVTGGMAGGDGTMASYFGGAEGELYLNKWTLSAGAGVAHIGGLSTRGYGQAGIAFYPDEDFKLSVGGGYSYKNFLAGARAEWQPQGSPVSFYLEGKQSDHAFSQGMIGLRIYLGSGGKSLMRRNREDDPEPMLFDFTTQAYVTHERFATINGLPRVHNGTCPPGYFYDPTLSLTVCFR